MIPERSDEMIPLGPVDAIAEMIDAWHHRLSWDEYFMATVISNRQSQ